MAEGKKDVVVSKGQLQKAPARLVSPFDEMERMFSEFFGRSALRPFRWAAFLWGRRSPLGSLQHDRTLYPR
jgi:hypothetical protein